MKKIINLEDYPLLQNIFCHDDSVFTVESLLENARRQKNIKKTTIPKVCILDPDGDVLDYLKKQDKITLNQSWPCYHTNLYDFYFQEYQFGLIASVVGAPFATVVAEELFASGCQVIFHLTSAGKVDPSYNQSRFLIIEKALRDEGTSYHYIPPSEYSLLNDKLRKSLKEYCKKTKHPIKMGNSWTTDAPFRETQAAIESAKRRGITVVEMETSALYALARYRDKSIISIAHITNEMGQPEKDFEKGKEGGSLEALKIIRDIATFFQL